MNVCVGLALGLLGTLLVLPTAAATGQQAEGRAWHRGVCTNDRGVSLVIDFRSLDRRSIVRCVSRRVGPGFTGRDALQAANIRIRGVDGYGASFVCRLQGRPTAREDVDPGQGVYRERCNRIPPRTAYWSYWHARDGGRWRYSNVGYTNRHVIRGGFEGWSFHAGRGDVKPPRRAPRHPGRVSGMTAVATQAATPLAVTAAAGLDLARTVPAARAAQQAAGWLIGDLRGGRLPGPSGRTDWGLTIDALWALHAAGVGSNSADRIVDALSRSVDAFIGPIAYRDPRARIAGATAKTLVAAAVAGREAARFGGYDLRAEVLRLMQGQDGAQPGRFSDRRTGGDTSNTVSQSLAVVGLALTGSVPAPAVTFLDRQQCPAGWFRMYADGGGTCSAGRSSPDVDGTAMAVQALLAARADGAPGLGSDIRQALDWLVAEQERDGSFAGGEYTRSPNANSTGLAGQALAAGGRTAAAADATGWLRSVQLEAEAVDGTRVAAEVGAVGYDSRAYAGALSRGIAGYQRDQWRRSTAQAVLGLAPVSFLQLRAKELAADPGTAPGPVDSAAAEGQPAADDGSVTLTGRPPAVVVAGLLALVTAAALLWLARRRARQPA